MKLKQLPPGLKLINCENFDIAASCEAKYDKFDSYGKHVYYPASFLIYVEKGDLEVIYDNEVYNYPEGSFCLIRKYTDAYFSQTFSKKAGYVRSYTLILPDQFLRKIISNYKFDKNLVPIGEKVLELEQTDQLKTIMQSIVEVVDHDKELNVKEIEANVENTLKAIIKSNPKLAVLFKEFSLAQRADLTLFMNSNFKLGLPLEVLAEMSGRSLSTFTREFKLIFGTTPHQWILKKRLKMAYNLLSGANKSISEVYLDTGFEDLAHFSKAFKKEFGKNPSEVKGLGDMLEYSYFKDKQNHFSLL